MAARSWYPSYKSKTPENDMFNSLTLTEERSEIAKILTEKVRSKKKDFFMTLMIK